MPTSVSARAPPRTAAQAAEHVKEAELARLASLRGEWSGYRHTLHDASGCVICTVAGEYELALSAQVSM